MSRRGSTNRKVPRSGDNTIATGRNNILKSEFSSVKGTRLLKRSD